MYKKNIEMRESEILRESHTSLRNSGLSKLREKGHKRGKSFLVRDELYLLCEFFVKEHPFVSCSE